MVPITSTVGSGRYHSYWMIGLMVRDGTTVGSMSVLGVSARAQRGERGVIALVSHRWR